MVPPIATAMFDYGPLVISVAVASIAWLGNKSVRGSFKKIFLETAFIYSLAMVAVAFLGITYDPAAALDRYLGLGSLLLLSIIASVGFLEFLRRGLLGKVFAGFLVVLLVTSIGFGAVLTPEFNPFNAKNGYSVQSPPTWGDKTSLATVVSYVNNGTMLTDWKTGQMIVNSYYTDFSVQNETSFYASSTLFTPQGIVTIITLGTYSLSQPTITSRITLTTMSFLFIEPESLIT